MKHEKTRRVLPPNRFETDNRIFQLMIAAVVQVSKLVWKLKTLRLSHSPTILWAADAVLSLDHVLCLVMHYLDYNSNNETERKETRTTTCQGTLGHLLPPSLSFTRRLSEGWS